MALNDSKNSQFSAYHGGSWSQRTESHSKEMRQKKYWPVRGTAAEYTTLRHALLWTPPLATPHITDPEQAQHLRHIDWNTMRAEHMALKQTFESLGVQIHTLEADAFSDPPPNLMFTRDHFFMTPWGVILARMASPVRAAEEKWAQLALAQAGVPILCRIHSKGLFEGADALWLDPKTVLIGIGNRTNTEGALQIKNVLDFYNVDTVLINLPRATQHLLGVLQIVDSDIALLRSTLLDSAFCDLIHSRFANCVSIPESPEVTERQGMNVVCIEPKTVIMAAHCSQLRTLYETHGIRVAAEVEISQYLNAAGGIACATGILERAEVVEKELSSFSI